MSPHSATLPRPQAELEPRFEAPVADERDDLPPTFEVPHAPLGDPEFMAHR